MLNLDEAIIRFEEKTKELKEKAESNIIETTEEGWIRVYDGKEYNDCLECAREQEQLAEWLKDYKRLLEEKPQGEREFIKIITQYLPDDIVTYPEYRGKPYYSIQYLENGEEFVGYGTYNISVLSRYLRTYFFGQKGEEE